MFRALLCSSSGGQIVLVQHLVSSLSLGDCSVHRLRESSRNLCTEHSRNLCTEQLPKESDVPSLREDCSPPVTCVLNSHLKGVTIPDAVLIQFVLLKMSIIVVETCRGI